MNDTPETDRIARLLENLDEWIDDSLRKSKPIGLTLCAARSTIADHRARITEMWDALETLRRERDEAREEIKELIYIAERAIALAEIDFENDKFGVVSELRDGVERIKEGAK
jgi:NifB/MoaA-like Fe-S oxidoreductase